MALSVECRAAIELHPRASAIAKELRMEPAVGPRPDLAEACLAVQRIVSAARAEERRDPYAPKWLAQPHDAFEPRLRSQSAAGLRGLAVLQQANSVHAAAADRQAAIALDKAKAAEAYAAGRAKSGAARSREWRRDPETPNPAQTEMIRQALENL